MRHWLLLIVVLCMPTIGWAQFDPFNTPRPKYFSPDKLFALDLPAGWEAETDEKNPNSVVMRDFARPTGAWMSVIRVDRPTEATPKYMLLVAIEQRMAKMPGIALDKKRDLRFNGNNAAAITGTYWYQGNVQFKRWFEETYIAVGQEAFVLHFECAIEAIASIIADKELLYKSMLFHPPGQGEIPFAPLDDQLDKIQF